MLGWLLADYVGKGRSLGGCELPTSLKQEVPGRERCDREGARSITIHFYTITVYYFTVTILDLASWHAIAKLKTVVILTVKVGNSEQVAQVNQ